MSLQSETLKTQLNSIDSIPSAIAVQTPNSPKIKNLLLHYYIFQLTVTSLSLKLY